MSAFGPAPVPVISNTLPIIKFQEKRAKDAEELLNVLSEFMADIKYAGKSREELLILAGDEDRMRRAAARMFPKIQFDNLDAKAIACCVARMFASDLAGNEMRTDSRLNALGTSSFRHGMDIDSVNHRLWGSVVSFERLLLLIALDIWKANNQLASDGIMV